MQDVGAGCKMNHCIGALQGFGDDDIIRQVVYQPSIVAELSFSPDYSDYAKSTAFQRSTQVRSQKTVRSCYRYGHHHDER
jgi:hypothetical protein